MGLLSRLFKLFLKRGESHVCTLSDLYRLRRNIAESRQKPCLTQYDELHTFFISLSVGDQPYNLGIQEKLKFRAVAFYTDEVFGSRARIPDGEKYLYRICSIVDVVKGTEWLDRREEAEVGDWEQVYIKSRGDWAPLSQFARGHYHCEPRHFSWWTTFPLFQDVIRGAHHIGMTNDWVAEQCVVLRCPAEYVTSNGLGYVPSVIDAYTQMIFHPTRHDASPSHGITINLSLYPEVLTPGIDEVLLPALPVEILEIMPVNVTAEYCKGKKKVHSEEPELHGLLKSYYENIK